MRQICAAHYAPDRRSSRRDFPLSILETRLQEANDRRSIDHRRRRRRRNPLSAENAQLPLSLYAEEKFAATHNQRSAACRFMDCRVIRGNDAIRAHRRAAPVRIFRNLCVHERR